MPSEDESTPFQQPHDHSDSSVHFINSKKLLAITLVLFVCFSTFSAAIGITLMAIIQPGNSNHAVKANLTTSFDNQLLNKQELQSELIDITKRRIEQHNSKSDSFTNIIL